jgi:hypothetical protein
MPWFVPSTRAGLLISQMLFQRHQEAQSNQTVETQIYIEL